MEAAAIMVNHSSEIEAEAHVGFGLVIANHSQDYEKLSAEWRFYSDSSCTRVSYISFVPCSKDFTGTRSSFPCMRRKSSAVMGYG